MTLRVERILWALAFVAGLTAIAAARNSVAAPLHSNVDRPPSHTQIMMFGDTPIATAATTTITHDPFRLDHHPANVAFGSPIVQNNTPKLPSPDKALTLKGIMGGPPWQAILGGAPDRTGNIVVHMGDTVAGFHVRRVQRDKIILAGSDSLLTLTLQRTWQ